MNRSILNNLRRFAVQESVWNRVPYSRRAGVLLVLYENKWGDLSCILTMRTTQLSSFGGHAALPGGKADFEGESAIAVARRETHEEIGISQDDIELARQGYQIEHLTTLPAYLSRNLLAVRPSVVYLSGVGHDPVTDLPHVLEKAYLPSAEVSEVFSAPFADFLSNRPGWYTGKYANWGGLKWNQHWFKTIRKKKEVGENGWYNVWGLTANILIDAARIAYQQEPMMEHRKPGLIGDEQLIEGLIDRHVLGRERIRGESLHVDFKKLFGKHSPLLQSRQG